MNPTETVVPPDAVVDRDCQWCGSGGDICCACGATHSAERAVVAVVSWVVGGVGGVLLGGTWWYVVVVFVGGGVGCGDWKWC